ncbi:SusE domain-containing protein [Joostella sp. CR20]|uniref:SusE domain-containing protein n=1 Tax=Joostella sp. CR20 TaxID=2804312 RepID=UPI00313EA871
MKKISVLLFACTATLGFHACSNDDDIANIAMPSSEEIAFENTIEDLYTLDASENDSIAETFTWNAVDFNAPTPVYYELQASPSETFEDITVIASNLSAPTYDAKVKDMIAVANEAGIDNDAETEAPNTGTIYFKARAYVGSNGGNTVEKLSEAIAVNVELVEGEVSILTTWGLVGSATPNGWDGPDVPFVLTDDENVVVAYANLIDGEIKIRENNDWTLNYGDTGNDGTLEEGGDNIPVTAGSYKIEFNISDLTYTMTPFSWGIVGSATANGWDGPDELLTFDATTNTWGTTATFVDGEIKFRQNNEWVLDYGDTGVDGVLDQGGDNIAITAGTYTVTVSFDSLKYTLETN